MDGNSIPSDKRAINHYPDINGDDRMEFMSKEEYIVHIDGGDYLWPGKNYVSENDIRKEQNLPLRISYEPSFWSEIKKAEEKNNNKPNEKKTK